jgi:hypothetical protein
MSHARVWASIKADNTGRMRQLPVILISVDGKLKVLEPALRYLNTMADIRSHSWMILPRSSGHSAKRVISKPEVNNETKERIHPTSCPQQIHSPV